MKKTLIILSAIVLFTLVLFFGFCFMMLEINPFVWEKGVRVALFVCWFSFIPMITVVFYQLLEEK